MGDGDVYGIVAQRYDDTGAPDGTEFGVNTFTTAGQDSPSVAMAADGSFLVVWESFTQDGDQSGVAGRLFDASGAPLGTDFLLNTYTTGSQLEPSSAALEDGGFAVAWESAAQDGDGYGVVARTLDAGGAPTSAEIAVNSYTTADQRAVRVAARGGGDFVVAWSGNADSDPDAVSARLVDGAGTRRARTSSSTSTSRARRCARKSRATTTEASSWCGTACCKTATATASSVAAS